MPISQEQLNEMAKNLPTMANDPQSVRQRVEAMEVLLERSFRIPGVNLPVGLDSIIGLVPIVGDIITAMMGAYMVWEARNLGMSKWQLTRMAANVGIDALLGAVPLAGDLFDFFWRSNTKNLRIIKRHLDKKHPGTKIIDV